MFKRKSIFKRRRKRGSESFDSSNSVGDESNESFDTSGSHNNNNSREQSTSPGATKIPERAVSPKWHPPMTPPSKRKITEPVKDTKDDESEVDDTFEGLLDSLVEEYDEAVSDDQFEQKDDNNDPTDTTIERLLSIEPQTDGSVEIIDPTDGDVDAIFHNHDGDDEQNTDPQHSERRNKSEDTDNTLENDDIFVPIQEQQTQQENDDTGENDTEQQQEKELEGNIHHATDDRGESFELKDKGVGALEIDEPNLPHGEQTQNETTLTGEDDRLWLRYATIDTDPSRRAKSNDEDNTIWLQYATLSENDLQQPFARSQETIEDVHVTNEPEDASRDVQYDFSTFGASRKATKDEPRWREYAICYPDPSGGNETMIQKLKESQFHENSTPKTVNTEHYSASSADIRDLSFDKEQRQGTIGTTILSSVIEGKESMVLSPKDPQSSPSGTSKTAPESVNKSRESLTKLSIGESPSNSFPESAPSSKQELSLQSMDDSDRGPSQVFRRSRNDGSNSSVTSTLTPASTVRLISPTRYDDGNFSLFRDTKPPLFPRQRDLASHGASTLYEGDNWNRSSHGLPFDPKASVFAQNLVGDDGSLSPPGSPVEPLFDLESDDDSDEAFPTNASSPGPSLEVDTVQVPGIETFVSPLRTPAINKAASQLSSTLHSQSGRSLSGRDSISSLGSRSKRKITSLTHHLKTVYSEELESKASLRRSPVDSVRGDVYDLYNSPSFSSFAYDFEDENCTTPNMKVVEDVLTNAEIRPVEIKDDFALLSPKESVGKSERRKSAPPSFSFRGVFSPTANQKKGSIEASRRALKEAHLLIRDKTNDISDNDREWAITVCEWFVSAFRHESVLRALSSELEFLNGGDRIIDEESLDSRTSSEYILKREAWSVSLGRNPAESVLGRSSIPRRNRTSIGPFMPSISRYLCTLGRECHEDQPTLEHQLETEPNVEELLLEAEKKRSTLLSIMTSMRESVIESTSCSKNQIGDYPRTTIGIKSKGRIIEKAKREYHGDVKRVKDILRGSIILRDGESFVYAIKSLKDQLEGDASAFTVVRVKNLFGDSDLYGRPTSRPLPTGYRHVLLNLRLDGGLLVEIQLHHASLFAVKEERGYELHRDIISFFGSKTEAQEVLVSTGFSLELLLKRGKQYFDCFLRRQGDRDGKSDFNQVPMNQVKKSNSATENPNVTVPSPPFGGGIAAAAALAAKKKLQVTNDDNDDCKAQSSASESNDEKAIKPISPFAGGGIAAAAAMAATKRLQTETGDEQDTSYDNASEPIGVEKTMKPMSTFAGRGIAAAAAMAAKKKLQVKVVVDGDSIAPGTSPDASSKCESKPMSPFAGGAIAAAAAAAAKKKLQAMTETATSPENGPPSTTTRTEDSDLTSKALYGMLSHVFDACLLNLSDEVQLLFASLFIEYSAAELSRLHEGDESEILPSAILESLTSHLLQRALVVLERVHNSNTLDWLTCVQNQPDRLFDWRYIALEQLNLSLGGTGLAGSDYVRSSLATQKARLLTQHPINIQLMLRLECDDASKGAQTRETHFASQQVRHFLFNREAEFETHAGFMAGFEGYDDGLFKSNQGSCSLLYLHNFATSMKQRLLDRVPRRSTPEILVHHAWVADSFFLLGAMSLKAKKCFSTEEMADMGLDESLYVREALHHYVFAMKGFLKLHGRLHTSTLSCAYAIARALRFLGKSQEALRLLSTFVKLDPQNDRDDLSAPDSSLNPLSPSSYQTAHSHEVKRFLPESQFEHAKDGRESQKGIAYWTAMCLWLSALLTVEKERDETSRQKSLSFLHAASVLLQRDVMEFRKGNDEYIRMCTSLLAVIEEEAKGMLQPLRKIEKTRSGRRNHTRRNRR